MGTVVVDPADPSAVAAAAVRGAEVLAAGGLVAFPTETVYGLGALARSPDAVARIFAAKRRPAHDPLIVHVGASWPLDEIFARPDDLTRRLIGAHWPGPLTIVGERHRSIPPIVTAGGATVAVRAPSHPVAVALLEATGQPVAAPSANRFSYVSATTAAHVLVDLGDAVDLIIDGGPATGGIESTVVAVGCNELTILRHGALAVDSITAGLDLAVTIREPVGNDASGSPGRMVKHYAPATSAWACPSGTDPVADLGGRICYAGYSETMDRVPAGWDRRVLGSLDDLDGVAATLYSTLRDVDGVGYDTLVLQLTGRDGLGRAIDDRLRRSASGRVLPGPA